MSRLVRLRPEEVCHIPRALDFFLTKEALESDAPELPHVLTWARCSPIRALSLLCQRTLPTHPLTAQGGCLLDYLDGILSSCTNPILPEYQGDVLTDAPFSLCISSKITWWLVVLLKPFLTSSDIRNFA